MELQAMWWQRPWLTIIQLANDYSHGLSGPSEYLANPVSKCEQTRTKPLVDCLQYSLIPCSILTRIIAVPILHCSVHLIHFRSMRTNERAVLSRTFDWPNSCPDSFPGRFFYHSWTFTFPTSTRKISVTRRLQWTYHCARFQSAILWRLWLSVLLQVRPCKCMTRWRQQGFKIPVVTDKCCTVTIYHDNAFGWQTDGGWLPTGCDRHQLRLCR